MVLGIFFKPFMSFRFAAKYSTCVEAGEKAEVRLEASFGYEVI